MATLFGLQPHSEARSIGNADRMRGNRRLFGRTTKKISPASWPDPNGLGSSVPSLAGGEQ
jgi:hypothetical protein